MGGLDWADGRTFDRQHCGLRRHGGVGDAVPASGQAAGKLERHRTRSFDEMQQWGDDLSGFDLVVALSPASQRMALELTRFFHLDVEYWPILDPTGLGEGREAKLAA